MKNRDNDFRIGTTSYIYPGNMLENIERLKGNVEDIELLYFKQGYSVKRKCSFVAFNDETMSRK